MLIHLQLLLVGGFLRKTSFSLLSAGSYFNTREKPDVCCLDTRLLREDRSFGDGQLKNQSLQKFCMYKENTHMYYQCPSDCCLCINVIMQLWHLCDCVVCMLYDND